MRTDIHRPSAEEFNPEAYRLSGTFDLFPMADGCEGYAAVEMKRRLETIAHYKAQGFRFAEHNTAIGKCGHCGAHMRYAGLMIHPESREMIWVGETCLGTTFESTRAEFRALRAETAAHRAKAREVGARNLRFQEIAQKEPVLTVWQDEEDWFRVERFYPEFVRDIYSKAVKYPLSDRQISAAAKAIVQAGQRRAEVAKGLEQGTIQPAPSGRTLIKGEIVGLKAFRDIRGDLGTKLIIQDERGFKVYVTCPTDLQKRAERGLRIELTATLTPSDDDPAFGFGSRPTKAKLLA